MHDHRESRIIRGASGLGDSIYLYPVAKYFLDHNYKVSVASKYPELFDTLDITVRKNYKDFDKINVKCNYCRRKKDLNTSQFEDTVILAEIREKIKLEIDFDRSKSNIIASSGITQPYVITSGLYSVDIPPYVKPACNYTFFNSFIQKIRHNYKVVVIGDVSNVAPDPVDYDLRGKTNIYDLLSLVDQSSFVFSQCGFLLPMGEALNKVVFSVLPHEIRTSSNWFVKSITPKKVCTKETSYCSYDDAPEFYDKYLSRLFDIR